MRNARFAPSLTLIFIALLAAALPAPAAEVPEIRLPNLKQADRSGTLGRQLDYLCQRQLGADCRDRLVFGGSSYLKDFFREAKPGQRFGEAQIRPYTSLTFSAAAILRFGKYDPAAVGIERDELRKLTVSLIGEISAHHIANADKSSWWWGNEWQSAYWTSSIGTGAWLVWDDLPRQAQRDAAAMVVYEADRFLKDPAPYNEFNDTKAEENAWNSQALVLAARMFPSHPNHAAWEEKAREYMVTAYAAPQDLTSTQMIDGKPLNKWLRGPNVHRDYTLENHGFFHPDYMAASCFNVMNLALYRLAGEKAPESALYNVERLLDILDFLTLPNGWTFYPQATDWSNYRHDTTVMAQMSNSVVPSPLGARCLRWGLDVLAFADEDAKDGAPKNLYRGLNFNCCPLDTMTHVYLMHYLFGPGAKPLPDEQARQKLTGTRLFEQGKCVVCRTPDSIASFSWFDGGNRLMAAVTPLSTDALALPKFRSLIGTVGGKVDPVKVLKREVELLPGGGFCVGISCNRGPDSKLGERIMMVALPDGRVIYVERFDASQTPDPGEVRAGLLFFESNPIWLRGAQPKVYYPGGEWNKQSKSLVLDGAGATWLNVGDRLGIVLCGSKSVSIEDGRLTLNYRPAQGSELPENAVAVFCPDIDGKATRLLSEQVRVETLDGGAVRVTLGNISVLLNTTDKPMSVSGSEIAPLKAVVTRPKS